jgi:hypothetical protein
MVVGSGFIRTTRTRCFAGRPNTPHKIARGRLTRKSKVTASFCLSSGGTWKPFVATFASCLDLCEGRFASFCAGHAIVNAKLAMRGRLPTLACLSLLLQGVLGAYFSNNRYNYNYLFDQSLPLNVCADSVVAVTYMTITCDSPYTFYYGNGANRNSPVCDYGDKVTLSVTIKVMDDLQEEDTDIYFTLAAFDSDVGGLLLTSTVPENLCRDYIGSDCTKAGIYTFYKKLKFGSPGGNLTKFRPEIHIAFSTQSDSGYNLGGVNMECLESDKNEPAYVAWSSNAPKTATQEFTAEYGMLLGTCVLIAGMATYVFIRSYDNKVDDQYPQYSRESSGEMSLLDL